MVLDNSAYEEGTGHLAETLLEQALLVGAREIVVPDVMHSAEGTLELSGQALDFFKKNRTLLDKHKITLMLVPHAATIYSWGWCANTLAGMHYQRFGSRPFTFGIPKDYEGWVGGRAGLIQRFILPLNDMSFETHLLGVGEDLTSIDAMRSRYPWIRSTDTAKPFVYAWHRIRLSPLYGPQPEYPGRPDNYFDLEFDAEQLALAKINAKVMLARAGQKIVEEASNG